MGYNKIVRLESFKKDKDTTIVDSGNVRNVNYGGLSINFDYQIDGKMHVVLLSGLSVWYVPSNKFDFITFISYCYIANVKTKMTMNQYKELGFDKL